VPTVEAKQAPESKRSALEQLVSGADLNAGDLAKHVRAGRLLLKQMGIEPGQSAVVVNGRVGFHFVHPFSWAN